MKRLNLYRKLKLEEMELCIENNVEIISNFINDESNKVKFIDSIAQGEHDLAFDIARSNLDFGYGYLIHHLKLYLDTKKMMENGEVIYTELLNTDTVL